MPPEPRDEKSELEPFGLPDAARADISSNFAGFIEFDGAHWGALGTEPDDLKARVFFGRKGSGKTLYLRRMVAYTSSQPDLCSIKPDYNPLETTLVVRFAQHFTSTTVTDSWTQLWRIAILRSVAGQVLFGKKLHARFEDDVLVRLAKFSAANGLAKLETELTVLDNMRFLLYACRTKSGAERLLEDPCWANLASTLRPIIQDCPPLCFYIDAVDDEFANAPMYWMQCQLGLFYQAMRLLRDGDFGGRLHLFVCLRDLVLVKVLASEHGCRYMEKEYIRPLIWNYQAAKRFLEKKLEGINQRHFVSPHSHGTIIEKWLGFVTYRNYARKVDEPISQYLLRHTRLLPRDIIILGNSLCESIVKGELSCECAERDKNLHKIVSKSARGFALEQLAVCANQISSDQMPSGAAKDGYSDLFTSIDEYKKGIVDDLSSLIESIGKDRFKRASIVGRKARVARDFDGADPFQALWQNGLLGYIDDNTKKMRAIFYGDHELQGFRLPVAKEYVLHPCLIDALKITAVGTQPIVPYLDD